MGQPVPRPPNWLNPIEVQDYLNRDAKAQKDKAAEQPSPTANQIFEEADVAPKLGLLGWLLWVFK